MKSNSSIRLTDHIRSLSFLFINIRDKVLDTQTHPSTIKFFRGVISVWVVCNTLMLLPAAEHFWSSHSYIPATDLKDATLWKTSLNLLSLEVVAPHYHWFLVAQLLVAICAGLSFAPRVSSALLYFLTMNLDNRAMVIQDGGNNLMHIVLFLLIFMTPHSSARNPSLRSFSNSLSNMAFFMVRAQVALVYATAGLLKVQGELWPKGVALYYTMNVLEYGNKFVGGLMADFPLLLAAGCLVTVLFQVTFPILIWPRATRPLLMAAGTFFHLSIVFVMGLTSFGFAMCASYFIFYTDRQAEKTLSWLRPRARVVAAFDADCGICQSFARWVKRFDWFNLITPSSAQDPANQVLKSVPLEHRLKVLQATCGKSHVEGYDAIVAVISRLPLLIPIVPVLQTIGYLGLGDVLYARIAQNRSRTCSVPQTPSKGKRMLTRFSRPVASTLCTVLISSLISSPATALPHALQPRPMLPSETRELLNQIEAEGSTQAMTRFLTPSVTQAIRDYSRLEDSAIRKNPADPYAATPAVYGAAAAGGAAAKVVEHVWDRYVGNGRIAARVINDRNFDLSKTTSEVGISPVDVGAFAAPVWLQQSAGNIETRVASNTFKNAALLRSYPEIRSLVEYNRPVTSEFVNQYRKQARDYVNNNPQAQWVMAVGGAAAAAVGYKAAEYALNQMGARTSELIRRAQFNDRAFDLR